MRNHFYKWELERISRDLTLDIDSTFNCKDIVKRLPLARFNTNG